ncbi:MAG: metallophosphoesterase [Deltaproteobacteria bacterium]|nr:metallophosphoesterase [Deltaproteobacteria bacterium]
MASHHEVVLVHSSDLHLSAAPILGSSRPSDPLSVLRKVLLAATAARADLLVLAGDTFEHNRQPSAFIDRAGRTMGEFGAPIVILPGNHDPLTPDSVYRRSELAATSNVCVLGLTVEEAVALPGLGLEVWGRAHRDYSDMAPLSRPRSRSTRWQLATAHGHYVEGAEEPGRLLGSWLIRREELIATGADYVALGHWNRAARVGDQQINAYYSGSPDYAGTVNVVRLRRDGTVEVTRAPLQ